MFMENRARAGNSPNPARQPVKLSLLGVYDNPKKQAAKRDYFLSLRKKITPKTPSIHLRNRSDFQTDRAHKRIVPPMAASESHPRSRCTPPNAHARMPHPGLSPQNNVFRVRPGNFRISIRLRIETGKDNPLAIKVMPTGETRLPGIPSSFE